MVCGESGFEEREKAADLGPSLSHFYPTLSSARRCTKDLYGGLFDLSTAIARVQPRVVFLVGGPALDFDFSFEGTWQTRKGTSPNPRGSAV